MINYRDRFMEDMRLRGYAEPTRDSYYREVKRFFERTGKGLTPQKVTEDHLREYFLHLQEERKYSVAAIKIAYSGLRFFLRQR